MIVIPFFLRSNHWSVICIDKQINKYIYFDSDYSKDGAAKSKKLIDELKSKSYINKSIAKKCVKVPQQECNWECGYYSLIVFYIKIILFFPD